MGNDKRAGNVDTSSKTAVPTVIVTKEANNGSRGSSFSGIPSVGYDHPLSTTLKTEIDDRPSDESIDDDEEKGPTAESVCIPRKQNDDKPSKEEKESQSESTGGILVEGDVVIDKGGGEFEIDSVKPNDVICGNEGVNIINMHPGNIQFRKLINKYKPEYKALPKIRHPRKKEIVNIIIGTITKEHGGRFLKKKSPGHWGLATEKEAYTRVSNAISSPREYLSDKQKEIIKKRKERNEQRLLESLKLKKR